MVTIDIISKPPALRAAQGLAVFAAAAAAGASAALSVLVIPRLLDAPSSSSSAVLARQWLRTYDSGKLFVLGLAGTAGGAFAYVAWATRRGLEASHVLTAGRLPVLAAGLSVALVPYTVAVMLPVNTALMERAAEDNKGGDDDDTLEETRSLVQRWGALNLGRTAFLATAAATGLVAFL